MQAVHRIRPYLIGALLGLLNAAATSDWLAGRPIGASTSYPFVADVLFGLRHSDYYVGVRKAGSWELVFLAGAFVGALFGALATGRFRVRIVPDLWRERRNGSPAGRLLWACAGGFALIFGARLAGGCTSGHILSGGMELAASSILFAVFAIASAVVAAKAFYRGKR